MAAVFALRHLQASRAGGLEVPRVVAAKKRCERLGIDHAASRENIAPLQIGEAQV